MQKQQEENGDLEKKRCKNICSCYHLMIYRILIKLDFKKVVIKRGGEPVIRSCDNKKKENLKF